MLNTSQFYIVMINSYVFITKTKNYGLTHFIILIICLLLSPAFSQTCGDGSFYAATQFCNDANLINGDGCNSNCQIQTNYSCVNTVGSISDCRISVSVNLTYVGVIRDTSANSATIYFTILPYFPDYLRINFNNLLSNTLTNCTIKSTEFVSSQNVLKAYIDYRSSLQGIHQSFTILFNNSPYFWNPSTTINVQIIGVNCQLSYNADLWTHNILQYVYLVLICIALIIFVVSIFWEKWIGLQLIQTYQAVFFLFALMQGYPYQFSAVYQNMRYANGYDDILPSDYYRTYSLSPPLHAISIQKQFLSNYNIMFILLFTVLIILIILALVRKRYNTMLEQEKSSKISKRLMKVQKVISFLFSRVFLMITFLSMFKIIFCFCVQLSTETSVVSVFADEINITLGMVAFVILFSLISFVLFWFLLLPANFTEDQQHMSLSFQNMSFYYPILYLSYQSLFIIMLAIYYRKYYSIYMVFSLQIVYFFLIILLRPYNTIRKLNKLLHNATIIINQLVVVLTTAMIIRWNTIIGTPYQAQSDYQVSAYSFAILALLIACTTLAIIRLVIFNREVSSCCKKQSEKDDQDQLLENSQNIKRMVDDEKMKIIADNDKSIQGRIQQKRTSEIKRKETINKPTPNQQQFLENNDNINKYLNDKYIIWSNSKGDEETSGNRGRNIKKSNGKKKASTIKTLIEEYTEMNKMRKQEQEMTGIHDRRERE